MIVKALDWFATIISKITGTTKELGEVNVILVGFLIAGLIWIYCMIRPRINK